MTNRAFFFALVMRALMVAFGGMMVNLGFSEEETEKFIGSLADGIVGIGAIVVAIAWAWWERKKTRTIDLNKDPIEAIRNGELKSDRHGNYVASIILLGVLAPLAAGCSASPAQKVYAAEQMYLQVNQQLQEAIANNKITDPIALITIREAAIEIDAALDNAWDQVDSGVPLKFEFAWTRVSRALDRILAVYQEYLRTKEQISWKPSNSSDFYALHFRRRAA